MRRITHNRVWMLIVVLALLGAMLWQGLRDYRSAPPALTELDTDRIAHIELVIAQGAPQIFVKREGHWWRTAPTPMRGNDAQLQRLANLAATPVARWMRASEIKAELLGLIVPSATLTLDGVKLRYGALTALDNWRYVEVDGRIALVPRQYSPEITLAMQPTKD